MKPIAEKISKLMKSPPVAEDSRSAFVRQICHEIAGSFFSVGTITELLKESIENKEDATVLLKTLLNACHLYRYSLSNFLEFMRFDAGLQDTIFEPINIRQLLTKIMHDTEYEAMKKQVKINLVISSDMPAQFIGDESRITEICANLLTNSLNRTPSGGTISIRIEKEKRNQWSILIEDENQEVTDQLNTLESFAANRYSVFSLDALSLITSKILAENILEGKMTISSLQDLGTRFKVALPFY